MTCSYGQQNVMMMFNAMMMFIGFNNSFYGGFIIIGTLQFNGCFCSCILYIHIIFKNALANSLQSVTVLWPLWRAISSLRRKPLNFRKGLTVFQNCLFPIAPFEVISEKYIALFYLFVKIFIYRYSSST